MVVSSLRGYPISQARTMFIPSSDHWQTLGDVERRLRWIVTTASDRPDIRNEELDQLEEMADRLREMFTVAD